MFGKLFWRRKMSNSKVIICIVLRSISRIDRNYFFFPFCTFKVFSTRKSCHGNFSYKKKKLSDNAMTKWPYYLVFGLRTPPKGQSFILFFQNCLFLPSCNYIFHFRFIFHNFCTKANISHLGASTGWPKSKLFISNGCNSETKHFWPYVGKAKTLLRGGSFFQFLKICLHFSAVCLQFF